MMGVSGRQRELGGKMRDAKRELWLLGCVSRVDIGSLVEIMCQASCPFGKAFAKVLFV